MALVAVIVLRLIATINVTGTIVTNAVIVTVKSSYYVSLLIISLLINVITYFITSLALIGYLIGRAT